MSPPAQPFSATALSGVVAALVGAVIFSVNDLTIKVLSADYPLHQVIMMRSMIGLVVILAVVSIGRGGLARLKTARPWMHFIRMMAVLGANVTYFMGLAAMPIADAVAIAFVAPVMITLLSIFVLREKVGPHRIAAVMIGLAGTVVMMRPGAESFQPAAILILISALCYACAQLLTRTMRGTESAFQIAFYMQLGFFLTSALVGLAIGDGKFAGSANVSLDFVFRPWLWPALEDLPLFLLCGIAVSSGGVLMAHAYRTLEAATVAPLEYVAIPMAIVWGGLIFGTYPDHVALIGMLMIVAGGLYTVWRESVRKKKG